MQTQNLLRHALSETISEGIINCLIVTNSRCVVVQLGGLKQMLTFVSVPSEANIQLTRLHEHLFARKLQSPRHLSFD